MTTRLTGLDPVERVLVIDDRYHKRFERISVKRYKPRPCLGCGEHAERMMDARVDGSIHRDIPVCSRCLVLMEGGEVQPDGGHPDCLDLDRCLVHRDGSCTAPSCEAYNAHGPHRHLWVADDPDPSNNGVTCQICGVTAQIGLDHFEREAYGQNLAGGP